MNSSVGYRYEGEVLLIRCRLRSLREINNSKPMLLLFLPQRCRQAVEIIFKFLRQFVFGSPYFFDYLISHLIFSHEFLRGTDFRIVITMQNAKLTDTWFHFGIIDMFEIPSHKIVDAVNGRKRYMKCIIYRFFW